MGKYLEAHGFTHERDAPGMAVDLLAMNEDVSTPSNLTIAQVQDIEALKIWCRIVAVGFEMPDFVESAWLDLFMSIGLSQ